MAKKMTVCKHCGESIPEKAKACPYCGSDEQTGWSEDTYLDGIDLPDPTEYDDLLEKEFGSAERKKRRIDMKAVVGAVTALVFVALLLRLSC